MTPLRLVAALAAGSIGSSAFAGTTYIETFDDGLNHTQWTWNRTTLGSVQSSGGSPGGYFQSALMALPQLFTSHEMFTGNFVERQVSSIGGDLATIQFATPPTMISISLGYFNGTPDHPFDDTYASFVTSIEAPVFPDTGWVSFDVEIPFDAVTAPEGWRLSGIMPQIPPTVDWQTLLMNVDEVVIAWGDPLEPQLLFDTVRGADNLRIAYNVPGPGGVLLLALAAGRIRRRRYK